MFSIFPAAVKLSLLSALHSLYSCDRVPSAPLEKDVDGCQATAYPCHDSEMWRSCCEFTRVSYYECEVRLPGT